MKKAFTLVEMIVAVTILWLILWTIFSIYFQMQKLRTDIFAKSLLVKNTNALVEKLNLVIKNYTIDYEEYFNRRITWCSWDNWGDGFRWNVWTSWYCSDFTYYGNWNSVITNTGNHLLYYCTSDTSDVSWEPKEQPWSNDCEWNNGDGVSWQNYIFGQNENDLNNWSGCRENVWWDNNWNNKIQSFWEYALQFWDVKKNADSYKWCKWDDDDTDLWIWPVAIWDNLHVKELYLISKDKKKRIFIRRKLVWEQDLDNDWNISTWEKLYKLQILKLRGFDIGSWHNANNIDSTYNDSHIDTWACDAQEWFICHGAPINWWFSGYNLPKDINDWWVDLTINDITVDQFDLSIFPTINPNLAWQDTWVQIYPYIILRLTTSFYPENYKTKLNPKELLKYKMNLQTTFSVKPY